jgi:hypothetical protein
VNLIPLDKMFLITSCGDVTRYLRRADDLSFRISDRRDRDRYVDQRAVLALAHGLEVIDRQPLADSRQDVVFLRLAVRWDQNPYRLADGFLGRVPEDTMSPVVPGEDGSVEGLDSMS